MHLYRSLLPDVEVLLGALDKTSKCSNKLLFVIINFYSRKKIISLTKFWKFPNFRISKQIIILQNFIIFTQFHIAFHNFHIFFEFQQNVIQILSLGIHVVKSSYGWHCPGQIFPPKVVTFFPSTLAAVFDQIWVAFNFSWSVGAGKTNFWIFGY